jgi:VanZ family protein
MAANSEVGLTTSGGQAAPSWRRRLWRYGPLLLWLGFIFYASTNSFSAANTSRIIEPLLRWLAPNITKAQLLSAHFIVRKCAHFTEYALLALLAARAFLSSTKHALRHRWLISTLVLVAVYALLDEYHQAFVPTRTPSIYDSMIDTAGGLTALVVLALWRKKRRN